MEKPPISNQTEGGVGSVAVAAETERFITLLDREHTPEELKAAFDELVKVMTLETFKRIKAKQEEKQSSGDLDGKIDGEIDEMKEELVRSVSEIAVLADNYQKE